MADEQKRPEVSDLTETSPSSKFQRRRKLLLRLVLPVAFAGSIAIVYYGWFVPEMNLTKDYDFCYTREMKSYQNAESEGGLEAIANVRGPRTGYRCPEIYRKFHGEE